MTNSNLSLKPIKHKFNNAPRGKYPRLIREFLASGETELGVAYEDGDLQNTYMGLRGAISNMGLRGKVTARRRDGEIHLIRMG